ncbi:glycosyltransferase [Mycobacterium sp. LTG2003]
MRLAIAAHGTRGDIEPCAALALECVRRGHDVRMAVPPNLVSFVEATGLGPVASYGVDSQQQLEAEIFRKSWKLQNPLTALRQLKDYTTEGWQDMSRTLVEVADGADLILTATTYEEVAANVAEYLGLPLAALHYFPFRANTQILPVPLPSRLVQSVWPAAEWLHWRLIKDAEDAQRRELGLPKSSGRAIGRILDAGALEIQAYDPQFFPGLAEAWRGVRPVIGGLTLQLDTEADHDVSAWIAAGPPPVYFGFGSMPVQSPSAALAMIADACSALGQRALICSGVWDVEGVDVPDHVKVVRTVNHSAVFPRCRALVHHGGAGTTAAGLRSGMPTFVLWVGAEQPLWAAQVKRLEVGTAQRFSEVSAKSLRAGLKTVLEPRYLTRAREVAELMTAPEVAVATAADLLEAAVRQGRSPVRQSRR